MELKNQFHWADYLVLIVMLVISLAIGLLYACKGKNRKTTEEYLMGGRQLQFFPVTLSMAVSVISTNSLLGYPAEAYQFGTMFAFYGIGLILAAVLTSVFFVPLMFPLKLTSAHEYLELRFNSRYVRYFGTCCLLITQLLYMGTVIFGPAIALESVTGIDAWISILLVSSLATAYTSVGGVKAVIWTDSFQAVIMMSGLFALIFLGSSSIGGIGNVIEINKEWGRLHVEKNWDPTTRLNLPSTIIGGMISWLGLFAINQSSLQRYCAMQTKKQAQISMTLSSLLATTYMLLSLAAGMVIFAFHATKECDIIKIGIISNANQILPWFTLEVLNYPGLVGLIMSSLVCAALSTMSTSLNAMAAVVYEDVLKLRFSNMTESRKTLCTKLLVVVFGVASTSVSYLVLNVGGNLVQISLSLMGATMGPLTGVFLLGALIPFANWKGSLCGGIISLGLSLWLTFGQILAKRNRNALPGPTSGCSDLFEFANFTVPEYTTIAYQHDSPQGAPDSVSGLDWVYSISFMWFSSIGIFLCMTIGILVSLLSGCDNSPRKKLLLFPCVRHCVKEEDEPDIKMEINFNDRSKYDTRNVNEEKRVLMQGDKNIDVTNC